MKKEMKIVICQRRQWHATVCRESIHLIINDEIIEDKFHNVNPVYLYSARLRYHARSQNRQIRQRYRSFTIGVSRQRDYGIICIMVRHESKP